MKLKSPSRRAVEAVTIVALVFALALIAWPSGNGRHRGRRRGCMNHLRNVSAALHVYATSRNELPPAYVADEHGRPMHSWRVLLLPYLEQQEHVDAYSFEEPWDGPNNSKLAEFVPDIYRCADEYDADDPSLWTSFVAVVGPNTLWPAGAPGDLADVPDGAAQTLLLAEVQDSGIHWMAPRDLHVVQMAPTINARRGQGISSVHSGGAHVMYADGHGGLLSDETSPEVLRQLIDRDDGLP